jgi:ankyrin repeat protein
VTRQLPHTAASVIGHTEIAMAPHREGADVCSKNDAGSTPLHCACGEGHTEVASPHRQGLILAAAQ